MLLLCIVHEFFCLSMPLASINFTLEERPLLIRRHPCQQFAWTSPPPVSYLLVMSGRASVVGINRQRGYGVVLHLLCLTRSWTRLTVLLLTWHIPLSTYVYGYFTRHPYAKWNDTRLYAVRLVKGSAVLCYLKCQKESLCHVKYS